MLGEEHHRKMSDANLPNFFILGAAKSGTTTLHAYLSKHPEIYMSKEKEPHFFNDDEIFGLGVDLYLRTHFRHASSFRVRGEATPAYFMGMGKVIHRMKKICGGQELKFILIFRNPVERAWSHYLHMKRIGAEQESFERALELESVRIEANPKEWVGYFSDGLYCKQLAVWLESFKKEQFLFLLTTDLTHNLEESLHKIYRFLDVSTHVDVNPNSVMKENRATDARSYYLMRLLANPPSKIKKIVSKFVNKRVRRSIIVSLRQMNLKAYTSKPTMDSKIELALYDKYLSDVECLEKMIDRDLSSWKKAPAND